MKRVMDKGQWTLFSPADSTRSARPVRPGLRRAPTRAYEAQTDCGELKLFKRIPAMDLWRKMLSMLFETGHPWITFKDPCNIRSPAAARGRGALRPTCAPRSRSTPTRPKIAVCNLGSVNLVQHIEDGKHRPRQAAQDREHGHAHARQRDRHQLLRRAKGHGLQPAPPPRGHGPHGLPGRAVPTAHRLRQPRLPSSSPTKPMEADLLLRLPGHRPSCPRNAAPTPPSRARCGIEASCHSTL